MLQIIFSWRNLGAKVGVVVHNDTPHKWTSLNDGLYDVIRGHFDFAIHLDDESVEDYSCWADRQYVVPHPLMDLLSSQSISHVQSTGLMVLGAIRKPKEKEILHRFAVIGRLRGMKIFVGSFRSFPEPRSSLVRWVRWVYWVVILGVGWNFGYVSVEVLRGWC